MVYVVYVVILLFLAVLGLRLHALNETVERRRIIDGAIVDAWKLESEKHGEMDSLNEQSFADLAKELVELKKDIERGQRNLKVIEGYARGSSGDFDRELTDQRTLISDQRTLSAAAVADCVREITEVKAEVKNLQEVIVKMVTKNAVQEPTVPQRPPVVGSWQLQRQHASFEESV